MKGIETREEKEKKESRNKLVIGIILVGIMVLSTAGYAFFSNEKSNPKEAINYNGIEFSRGDDGLWHATIQGYDFSFSYNPKEAENITSYISASINSYTNKPLYFSYDSDNMGTNEITRNIGNFVERVQYVCMDNCSENLPIKNCSDNIIIIKEANETLIKQEENCIYILAKQDDVLRASDKFIFKILGMG